MNLYTTNLFVKNDVITYQVYKEGGRLFFKPLNASSDVDTPIFWVAKFDGIWKPINIHDDEFIRYVQEDTSKHYSEIENSY